MTEETRVGTSGAIWRFLASCRDLTARDRRNSWRAAGWLFGWMVGFLAVSLAIRFALVPSGLPTYLAIAVSAALGLVALAAYARFIREADELHSKIHLEALALGFGGGFVGYFVFRLLDQAGVAGIEMGDLLTAMLFFYVLGLVLGARRYA